jgi:hypothetical protein
MPLTIAALFPLHHRGESSLCLEEEDDPDTILVRLSFDNRAPFVSPFFSLSFSPTPVGSLVRWPRKACACGPGLKKRGGDLIFDFKKTSLDAVLNLNSQSYIAQNIANKYVPESLEHDLSNGHIFNPFRLIFLIG